MAKTISRRYDLIHLACHHNVFWFIQHFYKCLGRRHCGEWDGGRKHSQIMWRRTWHIVWWRTIAIQSVTKCSRQPTSRQFTAYPSAHHGWREKREIHQLLGADRLLLLFIFSLFILSLCLYIGTKKNCVSTILLCHCVETHTLLGALSYFRICSVFS